MVKGYEQKPQFSERCFWNSNAYERNYWKTISKKAVIAGLLIIIALPIGTAWLGIPPIFKGAIKIIETIAYWLGWKLI